MKTLQSFSEQEENYFMYQARQEFLRIQETDQVLLEEALIKAEQERTRADQEKANAEQASARAEQAELKCRHMAELLRQAGINPDS